MDTTNTATKNTIKPTYRAAVVRAMEAHILIADVVLGDSIARMVRSALLATSKVWGVEIPCLPCTITTESHPDGLLIRVVSTRQTLRQRFEDAEEALEMMTQIAALAGARRL